jgi:hypothetical protein
MITNKKTRVKYISHKKIRILVIIDPSNLLE